MFCFRLCSIARVFIVRVDGCARNPARLNPTWWWKYDIVRNAATPAINGSHSQPDAPMPVTQLICALVHPWSFMACRKAVEIAAARTVNLNRTDHAPVYGWISILFPHKRKYNQLCLERTSGYMRQHREIKNEVERSLERSTSEHPKERKMEVIENKANKDVDQFMD